MATIDDVALQLAAHERIQQDRYEHLAGKLKNLELFEKSENEKGENMNGLNGITGLMGGGDNSANGLIMGALLGGGGLFGRNGNLNNGATNTEGCVTPTQFQAGLNSVTEANNTSTILQTLGDIKASVPLAEGQVQLALAGSQADLNRNIDATGDQIASQINAGQISNLQGQAALSQQLANVIATSLASQSTIKDTVQDTAAATNLAIANLATAQLQNTYALNTAIRDGADRSVAASVQQGEATRALISAGREADMQRQISDLTNALAEQRADGRMRASEINITNTNTATAMQMQAQNQNQQQFQILAQLAASVNNLANDLQQVKQSSVVFNSGKMHESGNQSAANTRVA